MSLIVLLLIIAVIIIMFFYTSDIDENDKQIKVCPPGVYGTVPNPADCSSFYFCPAGNKLSCSDGFVYNPANRQCVPKDSIDCGNRPYVSREY